tara:strand:+ start:707 stop:928 length:222 start_codon:yes stop_codon:yes gene_type:complete
MIYELIVLLLAIPVGLFIVRLTKDELKIGRKYFRALVIVSLIGIIGFWIYGRPVEAWSMGFVGIVSLVSLVKS